MRSAVLLALTLVATAAASAEERRPAVPASRASAQLRAELALARGEGFYLRPDTAARALELRLRGVALARYPVTSMERGGPRIAFHRLPFPANWDQVAYSAGRLEPARERDRMEIEIAPEGAAEASPSPPPIPPTAEESWSVPGRWRVVFAEGLMLEVGAPRGARHRSLLQRALDGVDRWRSDWRSVTDRDAPGRVRLRLQLAPEDAAALYRSLPPDIALVIASAGPAT